MRRSTRRALADVLAGTGMIVLGAGIALGAFIPQGRAWAAGLMLAGLALCMGSVLVRG